MATIRAYTDLEQSKKLAEILPIESADMVLWGKDFKSVCADIHAQEFMNGLECRKMNYVPCWSLAALLGVLPEGWSSVLTKSFDGEDYYCKLDGEPIETMADNPVDACVEMIEKLHELKML